MSKYREALKFFQLELTEEFYKFQEDAPKGMFDNLNKQMKSINEAVDKAEKYDKINQKLGCSLDVIFKALEQQNIYTFYQDANGIEKSEERPAYQLELFDHVYDEKDGDEYYVFKPYISDEFYKFYLADYQKKWWLREDKSE